VQARESSAEVTETQSISTPFLLAGLCEIGGEYLVWVATDMLQSPSWFAEAGRCKPS
jgi:drug/metabolite transporter superfamily protein YnfA